MEPIYPQELKEDVLAALTLSSLKHINVDTQTASALRAMKINMLKNHHPTSRPPLPSSQSQIQNVQDFSGRGQNLELPGQPQLLPNMYVDNYRPPDIPPVARLNGLIGRCSKPFEKQLTCSDVRSDQSRLTMNKADVERCILPLLNLEEENLYGNGIGVTIYDPEGNEYPMKFKIWASKVYVLTAGWKEFYQKHELKENQDFVTIWMFRRVQTGKLGFVISWRRLPVFGPIRKRRVDLEEAFSVEGGCVVAIEALGFPIDFEATCISCRGDSQIFRRQRR